MSSCQPVTHAHIMFHKLMFSKTKRTIIGFASKEFGSWKSCKLHKRLNDFIGELKRNFVLKVLHFITAIFEREGEGSLLSKMTSPDSALCCVWRK